MEHDWHRFDVYAKHVRLFRLVMTDPSFQFGTGHNIHPIKGDHFDKRHFRLIARLVLLGRSRLLSPPVASPLSLLPNVKKIIHSGFLSRFDQVIPFLGQTLEVLDLRIYPNKMCSPDASFSPLLSTIAYTIDSCPLLQTLSLTWFCEARVHKQERRLLSVLRMLIPSFTSVCTLHLSAIRVTPVELIALSGLPSLTTLECEITHYDFDDFPGGFGFPALMDLTIESWSFDHCLGFLDLLNSTPLKRIAARSFHPISSNTLRIFFEALVSRPTALEGVDVSELKGHWHEAVPSATLIFPSHIQPLFAFLQLKLFRLNINAGYSELDDTFAEAMSRAWSDLEVLDIGASTGVAFCSTAITRKGLESLVGSCSNLRTVGIGIHFLLEHKKQPSDRHLSVVPVPLRFVALHQVDVPGLKVTRVLLGSAAHDQVNVPPHVNEISLPRALGYLLALFPNLQSMDYGGGLWQWREANRLCGLSVRCMTTDFARRWDTPSELCYEDDISDYSGDERYTSGIDMDHINYDSSVVSSIDSDERSFDTEG